MAISGLPKRPGRVSTSPAGSGALPPQVQSLNSLSRTRIVTLREGVVTSMELVSVPLRSRMVPMAISGLRAFLARVRLGVVPLGELSPSSLCRAQIVFPMGSQRGPMVISGLPGLVIRSGVSRPASDAKRACLGGSIMKSVYSRKSQKLPIPKTLVAFLLVIVLAACGTNATTTSSSTQPRPGSTATKSATTPAPLSANSSISSNLNLNAANTSTKIGDLLVQSSYGFQCPYTSITPQDLELGHLVLVSDRTTYSQAEIAQMSAYLTYYIENRVVLHGVSD